MAGRRAVCAGGKCISDSAIFMADTMFTDPTNARTRNFLRAVLDR